MGPHFILLDGPDAVGKTTFAERFVAKHGGNYIHLTYVKGAREMFRLNYMALYRAQCWLMRGVNVIIDRAWISENIYSSVYRIKSELAYDVRGLDRVIMRMCGVYVICAPDPTSAVRRHADSYTERPEMYSPDNRIRMIAERYCNFERGLDFAERKWKPVDYAETYMTSMEGFTSRSDAMSYNIDCDGDNLSRKFDEAIHYSECLQASQYSSARTTRNNFLGQLQSAKYLFVGDRINPNKSGVWPFVDCGSSSRVLSKALHELNFYEPNGVWTNGNDPDDHLSEIIAEKPQLKVIALGNEAAAACGRANILHNCVYHPSYVGRFSKQEEYLRQLAAIIK